jgi:hypothetical protein
VEANRSVKNFIFSCGIEIHDVPIFAKATPNEDQKKNFMQLLQEREQRRQPEDLPNLTLLAIISQTALS